MTGTRSRPETGLKRGTDRLTESSDFVETNFTLSFFRGDIEKQKDDLEQILLQRLNPPITE